MGLGGAGEVSEADRPKEERREAVLRAARKGLEAQQERQSEEGSFVGPDGHNPVACSAFCAMAMLTDEAFYKPAERALRYLISRQQGDGMIVDHRGGGRSVPAMEHGLAVMALAEGVQVARKHPDRFGEGLEKTLAAASEKGVRLIEARGGGAWAYDFGAGGRESHHVGIAVAALATARDAGVRLSDTYNHIEQGVDYLLEYTTQGTLDGITKMYQYPYPIPFRGGPPLAYVNEFNQRRAPVVKAMSWCQVLPCSLVKALIEQARPAEGDARFLHEALAPLRERPQWSPPGRVMWHLFWGCIAYSRSLPPEVFEAWHEGVVDFLLEGHEGGLWFKGPGRDLFYNEPLVVMVLRAGAESPLSLVRSQTGAVEALASREPSDKLSDEMRSLSAEEPLIVRATGEGVMIEGGGSREGMRIPRRYGLWVRREQGSQGGQLVYQLRPLEGIPKPEVNIDIGRMDKGTHPIDVSWKRYLVSGGSVLRIGLEEGFPGMVLEVQGTGKQVQGPVPERVPEEEGILVYPHWSGGQIQWERIKKELVR
jgi:hypothetical protein